MRVVLALFCSALVLSAGLVTSHSLTGSGQHGRKLRTTTSTFYTEHQDSNMATVDTSYKSTSYTTEAQRAQVAQFAQAAAVAAAGNFPDLNSTMSSQTSSYDTTALLASYEAKKASATHDSSSSSPAATAASTASTASISSAHAMSQQEEEQQSPSTWTLSSFKDVAKKVESAASNATEAVSDAAGKLKDKVTHAAKQAESSPALQVASTAAVSDNIHQPHHSGSSASISASAGPITMYNAYQSSDFDRVNHPASAAIDGDVSTSSQTTVDTVSCSHLNQEGVYGTCGLMVGCMSAPAYTQAYASTPNYPFWTAEFSADASALYKVSHVVLTNRQDCCRCPLAGAKVYIGDPTAINLAQTSNPDLGSDSNWQLCATVPSFDAEPTPFIFSEDEKYTETFLCSESIVGKAVAIQLPFPTTILTLAEVEVVGITV